MMCSLPWIAGPLARAQRAFRDHLTRIIANFETCVEARNWAIYSEGAPKKQDLTLQPGDAVIIHAG